MMLFKNQKERGVLRAEGMAAEGDKGRQRATEESLVERLCS